ncbi:hypothetical protein WDU94_000010 [Cyamophila willieti]
MGDQNEQITLQTLMEEITAIRTSQSSMIKSDVKINKKLDSIQSCLQPIKQELQVHSKEIKELKQEKFRKRLIIFGLVCGPNEPRVELEDKILTLMKDSLNIHDFSLLEIDVCKRLGSRTQSDKPALLCLTTERRVAQILRSSKRLQEVHGGKINIREDLPPEIRAKRKNLLQEMKNLRMQGKYAIVKYDQLIVRDNNQRDVDITQPTQTPKRQKRALSQSPASTNQAQIYKKPYQNRHIHQKTQHQGSSSNTYNVETHAEKSTAEHTQNQVNLNESFIFQSDDEKKKKKKTKKKRV